MGRQAIARKLGRGRRTLAVRRCAACESIYGVALWQWSGRLVTETHGFCPDCLREFADAVEASVKREWHAAAP